ncbi:MAG: hypothetical protein RDU30_10975 [Desulfovibrionaceae bacterium]|nr:hypothetical protein [Desulfovibrionaceae bacterium]
MNMSKILSSTALSPPESRVPRQARPPDDASYGLDAAFVKKPVRHTPGGAGRGISAKPGNMARVMERSPGMKRQHTGKNNDYLWNASCYIASIRR